MVFLNGFNRAAYSTRLVTLRNHKRLSRKGGEFQ